MATLTVINPDLNGEAVAPVAAAVGGDVFPAEAGAEYLIHLRNGHSSPQSVSFDDPNSATPTDATAFNPDVAVPVANATERIIRVAANRFRNTGSGNIAMTYTGVTALTVNVYKAR